MKKTLMIFMLALGAIICQSCGETNEEMKARMEKEGNVVSVDNVLVHYQVVKIGNCEYITGWKGDYHGGPFLTHKGDCSNPIHKFINSDSLKK